MTIKFTQKEFYINEISCKNKKNIEKFNLYKI